MVVLASRSVALWLVPVAGSVVACPRCCPSFLGEGGGRDESGLGAARWEASDNKVPPLFSVAPATAVGWSRATLAGPVLSPPAAASAGAGARPPLSRCPLSSAAIAPPPPAGDSPLTSPSQSGPVFATSTTPPLPSQLQLLLSLSSLSLSAVVPLSSVNVTDPRSSESTEALPSPSPTSPLPPPPQDESWMELSVTSEPAAGDPGAAISRPANPPPPPP